MAIITYDIIHNIIRARELLNRWPGSKPEDLVELIEEGSLKAYDYECLKEPPEGGKGYQGLPVKFYPAYSIQEGNWKGLVFNVQEVEQLESKFPNLKARYISDIEIEAKGEAQPPAARMTTEEIIAMLDNSKEPPGFAQYIPLKSAQKEQTISLAERIAQLEAENAELRSIIKHPHNSPSGAPSQLEDGKAKSTRANWMEYMRAALSLAVHVMEANMKFKDSELDKACGELGFPALTEDAKKIFRATIPKKYIITCGRPRKNKMPG